MARFKKPSPFATPAASPVLRVYPSPCVTGVAALGNGGIGDGSGGGGDGDAADAR